MRNHRALTPLRLGFLLSLLLALSSSWGETGSSSRSFPIPLPEARRILTGWLSDSGCPIYESISRGDQTLLKASREDEDWQIVLLPWSPLASSIGADYTRGGRAEPSKLNQLWTYLEAHSKGFVPVREETGRKIPPPVLSRVGATVLIKTRAEKEGLQFSGFIVNREGWILSTAHDLRGVHGMVVILASGQEFEARLMKWNPQRDLSLISVEAELPSFVELANGRNLLKEGERVYAICHTEEGEKKILPGRISAPLRKVSELPMWQVEMETPSGSSGSPVFDGQGRFVSVVKGRYRGTETIGFLIPRTTVLEFFEGK